MSDGSDSEPLTGSILLRQLESIAMRAQERLPQTLLTLNQTMNNARLQHINNRMEAQVDAELKKCNPEYVPPPPMNEEDDVTTINSGVFIGSEELNRLNQNGQNPIVTPPANGKWWKTLLSMLVGALLTLLAIWLSWRYFFPPGDAGVYSIIAQPFQPPE